MHLVHALILVPAPKPNFAKGKVSHWRFGFWNCFTVGLYFPLSFECLIMGFFCFPHIAHACGIGHSVPTLFLFCNRYGIISLMEFIFLIAILVFSVVFHEVSHGVVANSLGDTTAKDAGRLTLNPLPHLDPVGSIILPAFLILMSQISGGGIIFGWAKPVPVNPQYFRDQKFGSAKVSLAGPASNLALALVFGLALRFLPIADIHPNLPLIFQSIVYINLLLTVFNLLPIPPLDGSHILFSFLPRSMSKLRVFLERYGLVLLFILIFFFLDFISLFVDFAFRLIVGA